MKNILYIFLFSCFLLGGNSIYAQSEKLKQANKQYELSAYNLAVKSYEDIVSQEPGNTEAMIKLAASYRNLNRLEESAAWYKKAMAQNEGNHPHSLSYALVLKALDRYPAARKWMEIYQSQNPLIANHFLEGLDFAESLKKTPSLYKVSNEFANSSASDFGPAYYKDKIVFSSARQDIPTSNSKTEKSWEGKAKNQLFISTIDRNNFLHIPQYLHADLRTAYNEGPVSYSKDGKYVAFTKNNFINGTRQVPESGMALSIYIAEVKSNGDWENAKPFSHNGAGWSSGFPHFADNGKVLYFASDRPDGFGAYDIYVSYKTGNTWSTPENLGPVVNTQGDEITPFLEDENLFFASNWHHGLGGFDVFRAKRHNGIWKDVYNLGNGVNSSYDDYGFIFQNDIDRGYLVSNRKGGKGKEDIYRVLPTTSDIKLHLTDAETGMPIRQAAIDFENCGTPTYFSDEQGNYSFKAWDRLKCQIIINKEGYQSFTYAFDQKNVHNSTIDIALAKSNAAPSVLTSNITTSKNLVYQGKLLDKDSNLPLSMVKVTALDKKSGSSLFAQTDKNGNYQLPLNKFSEYEIRFSKAGYLETNNQVNTADGTKKEILGVKNLTKAYTVSTDKPTATPPAVVEKEEVVKVIELSADAQQNSISEKAPISSYLLNRKGYSIQLAAIPVDQKVNERLFEAIKGENIYSIKEGRYKKIRLGIFDTEAAARTKISKAQKGGFSSAFIVQENINSQSGLEVYRLENAVPTPAEDVLSARQATEESISTPQSPISNTIATSPLTPASSEIMVKIASYRNIANFNPASIKDLGKVETRKSGDFTAVLIRGFYDLSSATTAQKAAVQKGYKDAYLVKSEGGKLKKIK